MHIIRTFFVCLLFMWKLKGEVANTISDTNFPYTLKFQSSVPQIHKYDVFVSFRGPDIREVFLPHLIKAFSQKKIVFFVDNKLTKGNEISQSLVEAIETSSISLVIFSQNYASSPWCLDELVKVVECREKDGQILLPVFYKVDPTIVRHQYGTFADAFVEHEQKYNSTMVQRWRSALKKSANINGFHSSKNLNDAELVEEIVKCVLKRLDHVHLVNSEGLIGIGKQISRIESLLQVESQDVRAIGIWGMSGIGKTTIAEEVYSMLCSEYSSCYFKANVREECRRHGIIHLKKELFSTLLGDQDLKIDTPHRLPYRDFVRLRCMKVLVVLDDVSDEEKLDILIGTLDWFGKGSRIIITTRDKKVLAKGVFDKDIYEVKPLNFDDSLKLFNLNAFEQNHTYQIEYYDLSKRMVKHAKGIPLMLEILGRKLHGKDIKEWEGQLERLNKKVPIKKVHEIIRLSYNDLNRHEKRIFLDIACFLDGLHLNVEDIKLLAKDHSYPVGVELESLKDKALITISADNVVSMHTIIQKTAWEFVREESIDDPENQSRLVDHDIYQVLKNNKGSEAIRSIATDFSIIKDLQLNPKVFAKMNKLQYLDIYTKGYYVFSQIPRSLNLPQGLKSLPNELRYLRWAYYPLDSLPSKFNGEELVVLNLQNSQVKKLWHQEKDVVNLKFLILSLSSQLVELPNLSKAKNLAIVDLRMCGRLTSIHPSIFSLNKLEKLDLGGCFSLTSLKSNIHLSSLRYLSLAGCVKLKEFSVTSKEMVLLNLEHTSIKELPSSIGVQTKLEKLLLSHSFIENLPKSIRHLSRLRHLELRHCRKLRSLPKLPSSLIILDATGCVSLENVTFPSRALQMLKENKTKVSFWNCVKLAEHSLKAIELNAQINMMKFAHKQISTSSDRDYDAQGTYVYPGSSVPKWFGYRTTRDYMAIDLSFVNHSSDQLAFIFCFIVPQVESEGFILRFNISVGGEAENIQVYLDKPSQEIKSDHVYLMCDQGLSRYLNSRVKNQPKFKIKVTAESGTPTFGYMPVMLRGLGVSPINISQYFNFIQQLEIVAEGPCISFSLMRNEIYVLTIFIRLVIKNVFCAISHKECFMCR